MTFCVHVSWLTDYDREKAGLNGLIYGMCRCCGNTDRRRMDCPNCDICFEDYVDMPANPLDGGRLVVKQDSKPFSYRANCTQLGDKVEELHEMVDAGRKISWEAFVKVCNLDDVKKLFGDYSYRGENFHPITGKWLLDFHIKDDWAVGFYSGRFGEQRVYWIDHSGIEFIFSAGGREL